MSTTLTWASSGNGVKTAATAAALLDDLDTLITSFSANAAFSWQKAGKQSVTTPLYLLLSRKDGSAGRIAIIIFTTVPTNIQPVLFDQLAAVNSVFIAWFPNGTGTTLSNLNATSGTVCGNDTGAVKCAGTQTFANIYAALFVPFYFDSYDGMYFGFANPAAGTSTFVIGAGVLVEDAAGIAYDATMTLGNGSASNWGSATSFPMAWVGAVQSAGAVGTRVCTNYGSANRSYFFAWAPSGSWAAQLHSAASDIMSDDANSKVWFAPVPLLGQTKGEGAVLKFRQIGFGTGTTNAYAHYDTTGPVVQAMQFCNATTGGSGFPWLTNFKI